jgi:integrase
MKDLPKGIFVADGSLGVDFRLADGTRRKERIKPRLMDSAQNRKAALKFRQMVLNAIADASMFNKEFDYEKYFPGSKYIERKSFQSQKFESVAWHWFESMKDSFAVSTARDYRKDVVDYCKYWGDKYPAQITASDIRSYIEEKKKAGCKIKTVRNSLIALRKVLNRCVADGLIEINPMLKLDKEIFRKTNEEKIRDKIDNNIDPFDWDEMRMIIKSAPVELKQFIELGFAYGLRVPNELYGLAWEDVDLEVKKEIHICRGIVDGNVTTLKTEGSDRKIDLRLFPHIADILRRQKALTYMREAVDLGKFGKLHFVFYNPINNKPYSDHNQFLRQWDRLLRKIGVRYRPSYNMRHTFATLSLAAGEDEKDVAAWLGHTTVQMVRKNYSSLPMVQKMREKIGLSGGSKIGEQWRNQA